MAELSIAETTADACCAPEQQATCCEPNAKADCCGPSHDEGCGCDAGSVVALPMAPSCALDEDGLRLQQERYRRVALGVVVATWTVVAFNRYRRSRPHET
jgi:hypothetical protein